MSVSGVSWLDLLYELCQQNGLALLLTAQHSPPGFAERSRTELVNLDVVEPVATSSFDRRRERLRAGDLVFRCQLANVDGDLDAAAELLVGLIARAYRSEAA